MSRRQRHVDVFEESLRGDAPYAVGELDEIVAGASGLLAAESIGENQRFGELTSAHQETGVVDDPLACKIHGAFFPPAAAQVRRCASSGATVPAPRGRVNTIRIVQRWNSRSGLDMMNPDQAWVDGRRGRCTSGWV